MLLNEGDAFNTHTSTVSVPHAGAYVLMFNVAGSNANTLVWLVVNNVKMASAWGHSTDGNPYPTAGNQVRESTSV